MIRICHSLKGLYLGGIETVIMNWYRNIDIDRIQFDFIVTDIKNDFYSKEIKQYGGNIYKINKNFSVFGKIKYLFDLYRFLKKKKYDCFFSHEQFLGSLTCMTAFFAGIKRRITVSHLSETYNANKFKLLISYLLNYLFVTDRLAVSNIAGLSQYGKFLSFKTINTGINIETFSYSTLARNKYRKLLKIDNKFIIGNVSRLSKDKNLFFLIDIFYEIKKQKSNAVLIQIGWGNLYDNLKSKIKNLNLDSCVILLGKKDDVYNYYQAMDTFIFPALNEGLGIVAIEAQCSGLPCFISDGVPDEAMICNTTKISLSNSAKEWANIILEKTKNFERKDCSSFVKKSGFDIKDSTKQIEECFF